MANPVYTIIKIPNINELSADVEFIAALFSCLKHPHASIFYLDFAHCKFLGPFAVAALGAFIRSAIDHGKSAPILWQTLDRKVLSNLCQNGFAGSFGHTSPPWGGNSVPYKEYKVQDLNSIMSYLNDNLLKKDWINFDENVKEAICGRLWEIFANAFEHSKSLVGVFSCGQQYPVKKQLVLSVVDIGVGIPNKVRNFLDESPRTNELRDHVCLQWAFRSGNSTAATVRVKRGLGLDLLREFVAINNGSLEIYSGKARAVADRNGLAFEETRTFFPGTVVNFRMLCDGRVYKFASS